ncbi:baseplate J/gp47 family protein [Janthinobacterium sp.]|uniref:baseplate assembly protein n=1 Tax=Janthinobacterium sp. TaxID=1871054 RepID=UPI00261ED4D0|nr:baseplate J/gp47 family protein [Janthinobacterium sp.]
MSIAIDLSMLPAPSIIEELDFETLLAARRADLVERYPAAADVIALESEPLNKLLEESAYRELILRQRINEAARGVMLAFARGSDLQHLAALFDVKQQDGELDDALRLRIPQSLYRLSVAGPTEAYASHARAAAPYIKDVAVTSPTPGTVLLTLLSAIGNGTASTDQIAAVYAALSADTVRPICDTVLVQSAAIIDYGVEAMLETLGGPSSEAVRAAAQAAAERYVRDAHQIGNSITRSGLYAALRQPGVTRVTLITPAQPASDSDILVQPAALGAAWCASVIVRLADKRVAS